MDYMPPLKISNDNQQYDENKRRNIEPDSSMNTANSSNHSYQSINNNHTDQITEEIHDHLDPEDNLSHSSYRERRNPLPPRSVSIYKKCLNIKRRKTNKTTVSLFIKKNHRMSFFFFSSKYIFSSRIIIYNIPRHNKLYSFHNISISENALMTIGETKYQR